METIKCRPSGIEMFEEDTAQSKKEALSGPRFIHTPAPSTPTHNLPRLSVVEESSEVWASFLYFLTSGFLHILPISARHRDEMFTGSMLEKCWQLGSLLVLPPDTQQLRREAFFAHAPNFALKTGGLDPCFRNMAGIMAAFVSRRLLAHPCFYPAEYHSTRAYIRNFFWDFCFLGIITSVILDDFFIFRKYWFLGPATPFFWPVFWYI